MAASDPTPYVATPTGTLQGVAAFSWDGSAWQPFGRTGPDVATPTGVLQGVAPFSWDGSAWQPSGRAQPGVATPTGVLDGVAVYTWSGSAWTPTGGTATPSTPSGALRGVAAFGWDGAAWQPAAQARASVPTPYGVLDGVAFFNWGGTAWNAGAAVPAGATLDLSFLSGTLDPRITFTRASTATYFDATGTMQTAGLNLCLQSAAFDNVAWTSLGVGAANPVVVGSQPNAPNGTSTAAQITYPAVSGAGNYSIVFQQISLAAQQYTFSVQLKGAVGGEQLYIAVTGTGAAVRTRLTLTTQWQRFSITTPVLGGAVTGTFEIGCDLRDGGQSAILAQSVFAWGAQVELGPAATVYAPTTTVANSGPRFDYDPVTHAARGLLIEEARTNMMFPSVPGATWGPSGATLVQNSGIAPDGTNSFVKLSEAAGSAPHYVIPAAQTLVSSQPYIWSVHAKAGENRYVQLIFDNNASVGTNATFDLLTGTITGPAGNNGGSTGSLATIQAIGGGVYRCAITSNLGANTTGRVAVQNSIVATPGGQFGGNSYAGTAGNGVYVWGAQFEQGAFPTSYIPTVGASVTRAQDKCVIPPANMGWFVSPGGSWMAEFIPYALTGQNGRIIGAVAPGGGGIAPLFLNPPQRVSQYDGAAALADVVSVVTNVVNKGASTWAAGTGRVCTNGGAVTSGAMATGFATLTTPGIGFMTIANVGLADNGQGYMRRVRYWSRVLSDAEMQQVTT